MHLSLFTRLLSPSLTRADKLPTEAALTACKKLLACGVSQGELSEDYSLIAASQVSSTLSPGLTLYNEIQEWPHWLSNP